MRKEIIFRTSPFINDFCFRKVCDRIEDDIPDVDMERIHETDPDVTMVDLVLKQFFELKYKPVTQITGWTDETRRPEYAYELFPKYQEEFKELAKDSTSSEALYTLIMRHEYDFIDDMEREYKYGEYTEDPGEIDEQIDEYLFEKYMDED